MRYILAGIFLFFLSSCTIRRKLYSSTQLNVPSLQQKNDHSFSAAFSSPSGFDFTGGYAITNHFAIIGGAHTYHHKEKQTEQDLFFDVTTEVSLLYRHKGYHGGLGVFFPTTKKNQTGYASFFAGYIKDDFRMDEDGVETDFSSGTTTTRDFFYRSNIGRFFVQGGFNAYWGQFDLSFHSRYNYVEYSNVRANYSTTEQQNFAFPPLGYSKNSQFIDFAFDTKYFFTEKRRVGMQLFGFFTARLNAKEFSFPYHNGRAGIGLVVRNPFGKND